MLINQIPWEREEKRKISVSREKHSQQFDWVLVLEQWCWYIIITTRTDCFLNLNDYAFIDSNIKVKNLWYRHDRLNLDSQKKVHKILFVS